MATRLYNNPMFIKLLVFEVLCQFGTAIVNPIVSSYAVILGASIFLAGTLVGLSSVCALFLRPLGSLVLNRISAEKLLLASAIAFASSSAVCALIASLGLLTVSRVIMGAAFVIKSSLVLSMVSAVVPSEYMGRGVGAMGLANIVANAIGPGFGAWIGKISGYQTSFVVSAALFCGAIVLSVWIKASSAGFFGGGAHVPESELLEFEEDTVMGQSPEPVDLHPKMFSVKTFPLAGIACLLGIIFGSITALVLLIGEERGIPGSSLFFFVYAAVAFLLRPLSSKAYDAFGLGKVFYPMAVAAVIASVVLAFADSMVWMIVSAAFLAMGQGCLYPCLQAEAVCMVKPEESSIAANTFLIGADAGMGLGPILSGAIFQLLGSFAMLIFLGATGVAMMAFYAVYAHQKRRSVELIADS